MEMKKLFSLALLVSAFAVAPIFAASGEENKEEKTEEKKKENVSWFSLNTLKAPINFVSGEASAFYDTAKDLTLGNEAVSRIQTVKNLRLFWYGILTAAVVRYVHDNLDDIKSAIGLGEDESDVEAGEIFASADKCGCEDAEVEAVVASEEEAKEEVCEFKKKEAKKAQA